MASDDVALVICPRCSRPLPFASANLQSSYHAVMLFQASETHDAYHKTKPVKNHVKNHV